MLTALNILFFVFHSLLILFVLTAWAWRKTRKAHLALVALTAFCWFVLGIWYGFGYCPCTDWHWRVRAHLGYHDTEFSYITFLINRLSGGDVNPSLVDAATVAVFVAVSAISVYVNRAVLHLPGRRSGQM